MLRVEIKPTTVVQRNDGLYSVGFRITCLHDSFFKKHMKIYSTKICTLIKMYDTSYINISCSTRAGLSTLSELFQPNYTVSVFIYKC